MNDLYNVFKQLTNGSDYAFAGAGITDDHYYIKVDVVSEGLYYNVENHLIQIANAILEEFPDEFENFTIELINNQYCINLFKK